MAVSAADFYTYAKSTGTEIPDSKQKEAELVPVINRWKKGRLREDNKPEQDNTGRNIGAAALGTGAAALAYGIGRRFGRGKGSNPVSKPPQASPDLLPNVDNVTGLADTTFIPSPITPQDSRGVTLVGTRNPKTGTYRAAVNDLQAQPQVKTEFQNQAAADRDWDLAYMRGREQGLSDTDAVLQAKRTVGQPVPDWYVPGPETEHRNKLSKLQTRTSVYSPAQIQEEVVSSLLEPKKSFTDKYLEGIRDNVTTADRVLNDPEFTSLVKAQRQQEGRELGGEANKQRNIVRRVEKEVDKTLADVRKGELSPRSYIESTGSVEPKKSIYITETAEKDIGPEHFMPGTNMSWDDVHWNAEIDKYAPDTLVAKQNLNDSALSIQSSEAVDTGLDQVRQRIDTEVQRDTDSISLGKSTVKTEVLQEDLLEQAAAKSIANNQLLDKKAADGTLTRAEEGAWLQSELDRSGTTPQELFGQESIEAYMDTYMPTQIEENKAQAAGLIAARRTQLEQAGLTPGTTEFDNALVKGWSARSDVEPSVTSEKFRENVVLPKEVEEVVSTKIPESDASNVAKNYYDPNTGNIEFATEEGGSPLIRDIYKERVVPSEDVSKAASGTSIRGKSRSLDITEPKVRTRTDEFTGDERPDRIGGTLPIGGVPHVIKVDGMSQKTINTPTGVNLTGNVFGPLPAGPINAPQLSKQEVVHSITQSTPTWLTGSAGLVNREDVTGGGAGMGVYGRQLGYVPGPTSATAGTKPTQLPQGRYGEFNPTTSRDDYRGYSNAALRKQISTGTYKSGKVSPGVKDAQKELTLRTNLNYPVDYTPSKETTINSMQVSDDIRKIYSSGRPDAQQQVEAYKSALRKKMGI